jgi:hypothetical protein
MDRRGPSSLQPSSLQPSSLTTLAARRLGADIPEVVARGLRIPRDVAVQIVADKLRITGGVVFQVVDESNGPLLIDAILTVYAGVGNARIVVYNTRIEHLDMTQSQNWVDLLERGVFSGHREYNDWSSLSFYLTREGGFVVKANLLDAYPALKTGVYLPYEEGVKIVQAIIDILVKHGR